MEIHTNTQHMLFNFGILSLPFFHHIIIVFMSKYTTSSFLKDIKNANVNMCHNCLFKVCKYMLLLGMVHEQEIEHLNLVSKGDKEEISPLTKFAHRSRLRSCLMRFK